MSSSRTVGARRRGWERQYYVDNSSSSSILRTTRAFGLTTDEEFIYECGRTQSDELDDCSVTTSASSYNAFLRKIKKSSGEVVWTRIYNGDNQDNATVLDMTDQTFYYPIEDGEYIYIRGINISRSYILRVRKLDGYIEESLIVTSVTTPNNWTSFGINNGKLFTYFHNTGSTNIEVKRYTPESFTLENTYNFTGLTGYGNAYNQALLFDDNYMYAFESSYYYTSTIMLVLYKRFDIDSSGVVTNLSEGKLTNMSSLFSGGRIVVEQVVMDDCGNFFTSCRNRNGSDKRDIVRFTIPSSGDITDYTWIQGSSSEEFIDSQVFLAHDKTVIYAITNVASTFTMFGYSMPSNTTNTSMLLKIRKSDMSIISATPFDISEYDKLTGIVGKNALVSELDHVYLSLRTNGDFGRFRGNDTPGTSTWEEPVIVKVRI